MNILESNQFKANIKYNIYDSLMLMFIDNFK